MAKLGIYKRVSTDEQNIKGISLDNQEIRGIVEKPVNLTT